MKYTVWLTQMRYGNIEVSAVNKDEAERMAIEERWSDIEWHDTEVSDVTVEEIGYDRPSREEVIQYFKFCGMPDWCNDEEMIQLWINPTNGREQQFWECVHEKYELCEFDRWQHFENVISDVIPWNCFCKINEALWEDDIEILEFVSPKNCIY